ncbi:hypothetical protein FXV91_14685 [Methanosarcina sp. DH2]|jgi:hypothetical protein|uniref:hypothetical protein n=1 Tax=unclassified Methanosarcina TaxID=2644672 RepID=UPI001E43B291|nr:MULTISPECIES: hypothetical protein [unclassified Methanosarcina]MCC4771362.1 hypothetical protein [Methanosarcina sp. DH2]MDY9926432.1 hypothetical protein [Methanosarcina sp.]
MLNQIDDTRKKRAVIIFLATILFISMKGFLSPVVGVGFVLQKEVIGVSGDQKVVIFQSDIEGILAENDSLRLLLPEDSENLQISEITETELKKTYPEIEYIVHMRLCTEDSVREYRVNREDFNILNIGTVARFEVYRSERTVIRRIIEV